MTAVHDAARLNMGNKGTAFDTAFHKAQQVKEENKTTKTKDSWLHMPIKLFPRRLSRCDWLVSLSFPLG